MLARRFWIRCNKLIFHNFSLCWTHIFDIGQIPATANRLAGANLLTLEMMACD